MSICKHCAESADVFAQNVKEWGYDAAISTGLGKVLHHTECQFKDCYCQHTIEKGAYVRDK